MAPALVPHLLSLVSFSPSANSTLSLNFAICCQFNLPVPLSLLLELQYLAKLKLTKMKFPLTFFAAAFSEPTFSDLPTGKAAFYHRVNASSAAQSFTFGLLRKT